eukprot:ANDGO_05511.mRNA.1 hypothetical protein
MTAVLKRLFARGFIDTTSRSASRSFALNELKAGLESQAATTDLLSKHPRGFARLDPEERKRLASRGGKASAEVRRARLRDEDHNATHSH